MFGGTPITQRVPARPDGALARPVERIRKRYNAAGFTIDSLSTKEDMGVTGISLPGRDLWLVCCSAADQQYRIDQIRELRPLRLGRRHAAVSTFVYFRRYSHGGVRLHKFPQDHLDGIAGGAADVADLRAGCGVAGQSRQRSAGRGLSSGAWRIAWASSPTPTRWQSSK
jgi:hypothetical protein